MENGILLPANIGEVIGIKRFTAIFLAFFFLLTFNGCSSKKITVNFYLDGEPQNLDPQLASNSAALLVIHNTFEGLTKITTDHTVAPACAEDWEANETNTVFTFTLKENLKWSNGDAITADDFTYGICRALLPSTHAPKVQTLFVIKNARTIYEKNAPMSDLGIETDGATIRFELEYPNADFPKLLSLPIFMPCPQDFFEQTHGKYGLGTDTLLYNGPFYLRKWAHKEQLRLTKNSHYYDAAHVIPSDIFLTVPSTDTDPVALLEQGRNDAAFISYEMATAENKFSVTEFMDTTAGLLFNTRDNTLQEPAIRRALCGSILRDDYLPVLPAPFEVAHALIPPTFLYGTESFRSLAGEDIALALSPADAKSLLNQGLQALSLKKLPKITLLCTDDMQTKTIVGYILQNWQKNLGVYINLEPLPPDELAARVASGKYQMAVYPIRITSDDCLDVFRTFSGQTAENLTRYESAQYDSLLSNAAKSGGGEQFAHLKNLEKLIITDAVFTPLYYEKRFFAVGEKVSGLTYSGSVGNITFMYTKKK